MDDQVRQSLIAAGAIIADQNAQHWSELVARYQVGGVKHAIANARRSFDCRQVSATQVASALGYRFSWMKETKQLPVAQPAPVDTSPRDTQPLMRAKEALPKAMRGAPLGPHTDWRAIIKANPGMSFMALATMANRNYETVRAWVQQHASELAIEVEGVKKRIWLKEDRPQQSPPPPAPPAAPTAAAPAPEEKASVVEVAKLPASPDAAPSGSWPPPPRIVVKDLYEPTRSDLLNVEPGKVLHVPTAFTVSQAQLDGPLLPLVDGLLNAFAKRRGYTEIRRQLAENRAYLTDLLL
jgi:hypothetical protein